MIKMRHNKPYEKKINFNKVEYSTSAGPYCATRYVKVPFFMTDFSSIRMILYQFHVDNNGKEP